MTIGVTDYLEIDPPNAPEATIIWLHGLGADGHDFEPIADELGVVSELGVRFVFPHAPERPITLNAGYVMRAWFDVYGLDPRAEFDQEGINASADLVNEYIELELAAGVPSEKIILAGFSQGAALALHVGLRYPQKLAGIIALSGFLPLAENLMAESSPENYSTPIFMAHGDLDNIVTVDWGELSKNELVAQGYAVSWQTYNMAHTVCSEEVTALAKWLREILG